MLRSVLLVLLVAVAAIAAVPTGSLAQTGQSQPSATFDVAVLPVDAPARTNLTTPGLDASVAVAMQRERASARLAEHSLEAAVEAAPDDRSRAALLEEAASRIGTAGAELRASRRDLRASVATGELSLSEYLGARAVLDARAERLRSQLGTAQALSTEVPGVSMRSRVRALDAGLTGTGGPVATRTTASITGEAPPEPVFVSTSANATALAMVDDGEYVRQGFRSDRWVPDSPVGLRLDEIETRAGEIYPTAFDSNRTTSRGIQIVGAGVYRIEIGYDGGTILAFLDGDTRQVFYEIHRRPVELIDAGPAVTATSNGSRLSVNRTYAGGPLRVSVVRAATGEPVQATVSVGDLTLSTGPDGVAWTVMPEGEARVVARTASGSTSLVVESGPLPGG